MSTFATPNRCDSNTDYCKRGARYFGGQRTEGGDSNLAVLQRHPLSLRLRGNRTARHTSATHATRTASSTQNQRYVARVRAIALLGIISLAGAGLVACGEDDLDKVAKSCEEAGGTYRGDQAKADEACAIRYGRETYYLPIDFNANRVDTSGDRRSCDEPNRLWREQLASRAEAAQVTMRKRESSIFHPETGVCEKALIAITSAEQDRINFSRYSTRAEDALCSGRGGRARQLAGKALEIRNSKLMRRVIRDSRTLDAQQAANRTDPGADRTPAILVSRCGADDEGAEPVGDADCSDFDSQAEAQARLDSQSSDPDQLDDDEDGRACEWLP